MTNADTNIAALRTGHDSLAELVAKLTDDDLAGPSGAAQWDVSQVLSHLGSGAELSRAWLRAALDENPVPGKDFNHTVWDRWNAMSRRERADGFLQTNPALVELYESLDADTRESLRVDLGFMPAPVDVATAARFRLSEFALHSWDVRAGFDENAAVAPEAAGPLLDGTNDLLAWISKPEHLQGKHSTIEVTTTDPAEVFALGLAGQVTIERRTPEQPDGTLALPAEAFLRLLAGRLSARYTPDSVVTTGAADLEVLRQVFPGY